MGHLWWPRFLTNDLILIKINASINLLKTPYLSGCHSALSYPVWWCLFHGCEFLIVIIWYKLPLLFEAVSKVGLVRGLLLVLGSNASCVGAILPDRTHEWCMTASLLLWEWGLCLPGLNAATRREQHVIGLTCWCYSTVILKFPVFVWCWAFKKWVSCRFNRAGDVLKHTEWKVSKRTGILQRDEDWWKVVFDPVFLV